MFEANLPYSLLTGLSPECFKHPRMFITAFDTPERDAVQYKKGLETGKNSEYVTIARNGTWTARTNNGGVVTSYEGIGYHASTAALLRGFLDSGTEVYVSRENGETRIQ